MVNSEKNKKKVIRKEVEISTIPNFAYEKPLASIDENGEPQITYRANGNKIPIKKLPLLHIAGYDDKDNLISYQPLDMVNEFLLSKAICKTYAVRLKRQGIDTPIIHKMLVNKTLETTLRLIETDTISMSSLANLAF